MVRLRTHRPGVRYLQMSETGQHRPDIPCPGVAFLANDNVHLYHVQVDHVMFHMNESDTLLVPRVPISFSLSRTHHGAAVSRRIINAASQLANTTPSGRPHRLAT